MDAYKVGDIVEGESTCTPIIYREIVIPITEDFACVDGNKHYQVAQQYSENGGLSWITYGTRVGDLYETSSPDCGIIYRWRALPIEEDWICENEPSINGELAFEFTGSSVVFGMNYIAYTATTSPYSTSLSQLGIDTWTSAYRMFAETNITKIISIPDTSNVTDMFCMFATCTSLTSLDLSNFNTSNVTDMNSMFYYCIRLTSLDLSNWDTSKVTSMDGMFVKCNSLQTITMKNCNASTVQFIRNRLNEAGLAEQVTIIQ
jgi:surface protein